MFHLDGMSGLKWFISIKVCMVPHPKFTQSWDSEMYIFVVSMKTPGIILESDCIDIGLQCKAEGNT